nr:hypothetical protein [uncultured Sphingomonas sp.]
MVDLSQVLFGMTLSPISQSYDIGHAVLTSKINEADEEARLHADNARAGLTDDAMVEEESGQVYSKAEFLHYSCEGAREALNRHSQAFVLMIHHAWEKHVISINPEMRRYKFREAYPKLLEDGWDLDQPRLERLRMTANFIKHESREILDHHRDMFSCVIEDADRENIIFDDDSLIITNDDIKDFLDAVLSSAKRVR